MKKYLTFRKECDEEVAAMGGDPIVWERARDFRMAVRGYKYSYHFEWQGRPIIQLPQDMVAVQELIWQVKPDLIIETGIAHGGSLILSASLMALLDLYDAMEKEAGTIDTSGIVRRRVLGIDVDIRAHNRAAILAHPLARWIEMIQGSSIAPDVIEQVANVANQHERVMVFLDSNHTHDHVLAELKAYAPLTTIGSYCVVFDTIVEETPAELFPDRPWGPGNSPKTAVHQFLKSHPEFEIDKHIDNKLVLSVAPDGYLRRLR